MIIKYEIPIPNYYGDGVFFKEIYFDCQVCPTLEQLKLILRTKDIEEILLEEDHPEYGPFTHEYYECLFSLNYIEDFPRITDNLIHTNSFVNHPEFGRQPISCSKIDPITI